MLFIAIHAMVAPMNVSLSPELEKFISGKLSEGRYQTASEVVREALRLLEEREQVREAQLKALRQEIDLGLRDLRAGRVISLDLEGIKREGRRLHRSRSRKRNA
ncbi:MAG: type II toxin-antitoxin system ParD family antitoxin [Terriglobales bacterium]